MKKYEHYLEEILEPLSRDLEKYNLLMLKVMAGAIAGFMLLAGAWAAICFAVLLSGH